MQICYLKGWITLKICDRIKQTINEAELLVCCYYSILSVLISKEV